jgi:hypothetical protein
MEGGNGVRQRRTELRIRRNGEQNAVKWAFKSMQPITILDRGRKSAEESLTQSPQSSQSNKNRREAFR